MNNINNTACRFTKMEEAYSNIRWKFQKIKSSMNWDAIERGLNAQTSAVLRQIDHGGELTTRRGWDLDLEDDFALSVIERKADAREIERQEHRTKTDLRAGLDQTATRLISLENVESSHSAAITDLTLRQQEYSERVEQLELASNGRQKQIDEIVRERSEWLRQLKSVVGRLVAVEDVARSCEDRFASKDSLVQVLASTSEHVRYEVF